MSDAVDLPAVDPAFDLPMAAVPVDQISTYQQYLPAIFQADEVLGRFLFALEVVLSGVSRDRAEVAGLDADLPPGLEEVIAASHTLFDPTTTRSEFIPWLATWVGLTLRADWDDATRRAFIGRIVALYKLRGTKQGLEALLHLYTGEPVTVDDSFTNPPHFFQVRMTLSGQDREAVRLKQQIARAIIDQEKPAHTFYALQIAVPTMRLPARLGSDETLLGTETSSA